MLSTLSWYLGSRTESTLQSRLSCPLGVKDKERTLLGLRSPLRTTGSEVSIIKQKKGRTQKPFSLVLLNRLCLTYPYCLQQASLSDGVAVGNGTSHHLEERKSNQTKQPQSLRRSTLPESSGFDGLTARRQATSNTITVKARQRELVSSRHAFRVFSEH